MSRQLKRRFQNDDEKKEKYNSTISSSIAEIIRFSLDDQFRSQCFQVMKVNNTNDFQLAIKDKLDSLVNPRSSTSPTLRKRPSFHDEEAERVSPPERSEIIPQVNLEKQNDEVMKKVEKTEGLQNSEMPNSLIENITDSHIDEIAKVLEMTNILMEENAEEKYKLPGTSGAMSNIFIETEKIKNGITSHNANCDEGELAEGFWPTEKCCLWDTNNIQESNEAISLQEEISDIDLNEDDTDW